jgi:hypothetical protein
METVKKVFFGEAASSVLIGLIITLTALFVGYTIWNSYGTMPLAQGVEEGFGGVAVGSGSPDCLRTSAEAAQLVDFFLQKESTTGEGADDLREFTLLLSKLACLKKDLMSPGGIVESTRYQPYSTAHDMEPVAETAARCFAKTIPPRDLALAFDKWSSRGQKLVSRLCTSYNVGPDQYKMLSEKFRYVIKDINAVAEQMCLQGEPMIMGKKVGGREVAGHTFENLEELGPYKGLY